MIVAVVGAELTVVWIVVAPLVLADGVIGCVEDMCGVGCIVVGGEPTVVWTVVKPPVLAYGGCVGVGIVGGTVGGSVGANEAQE